MVRASVPHPATTPDPSPQGASSEPLLMVFVCTANRCRSPLAEHIAQRESARRELTTRITSMGFLRAGAPTPPIGVRVAAEHGLDLSRHRSRAMDHGQLREADLILTMTRGHPRELVAASADLWPRVFPVKQFVAYTAAFPPPRRAWFHSWIAKSSDVRRHDDLLGDDLADGVADPLDKPIAMWRQTMEELEDLITKLFSRCAVAFPPAGSPGS